MGVQSNPTSFMSVRGDFSTMHNRAVRKSGLTSTSTFHLQNTEAFLPRGAECAENLLFCDRW